MNLNEKKNIQTRIRTKDLALIRDQIFKRYGERFDSPSQLIRLAISEYLTSEIGLNYEGQIPSPESLEILETKSSKRLSEKRLHELRKMKSSSTKGASWANNQNDPDIDKGILAKISGIDIDKIEEKIDHYNNERASIRAQGVSFTLEDFLSSHNPEDQAFATAVAWLDKNQQLSIDVDKIEEFWLIENHSSLVARQNNPLSSSTEGGH